jgi:hypothetical protein
MTAIEQPEGRRPPSAFWFAYGQVTAMLGALSLLVFLTHLFDFGLKGVVRDAFDVWTQYVRPFVGHPLQWLVNQLPEALRFKLSDTWKDYFAAGGVLFLSQFRFALREELALGRPFASQVVALAIVFFPLFLFWPLWIVVLLPSLFAGGGGSTQGVDERLNRQAIAGLAPLLYLGLLFAANAWLA